MLIFEPDVRIIAKTTLLNTDIPLSVKANVGQDQGTDMERLIEFAGRGCYDSYGRGRRSAAFHQNIKNVRHGSVLEHVSWTFAISGVSRGLTHELVRHRVGTGISQRSTRYTDESQSRVVVPPVFVDKPDDPAKVLASKLAARRALLQQHQQACETYEELFAHTLQCLPEDMSKTARRKTARGAARSVLGQDVETALTWTINARAFINAAMQRYNEHAEAEIRRLFQCMFDKVQPDLGAYLGDVKTVPSPDGLGRGIDPDTLWVL